MNKTTLILLLAVVVAAGAILVWWKTRPPEDCAFSGWRNTVGIELEASVKDLQAVKGVLGITDVQVREFDSLMKDYALKYDAACRDVRAALMPREQYTCVRQNMDRVLDEIRRFVQAVEAAKGLTDAASQKEVVLKALASLEKASEANYRTGCASALDINPRVLTFEGRVPERSIQITNRGNTDFNYSIDGWPEGFEPRPVSGPLSRGATASVSFIRTILPIPTKRPLTYHVRTNLMDDVELQIDADSANMALWSQLGDDTRKIAAMKAAGRVTVTEALQAVDASVPTGSKISDSDRYLLAATVLVQIDETSEATKALEAAARQNPAVDRQASPVMLKGLLAGKQGDSADALKYFSQARHLVPANDTVTSSVLDLFTGTVLVDSGHQGEASRFFKQAKGLDRSRWDPALTAFATQELCVGARAGCSTQIHRFVVEAGKFQGPKHVS